MTLLKPCSAQTSTPAPAKSEVERLLAPLGEIARNSPNLIVNPGARFESGGAPYELPRYLFFGDQGGDTPIRVGIFAAIHGDEPEGARAIVHFVKLLEARPELVTGYCLYLYPVCNPTGV